MSLTLMSLTLMSLTLSSPVFQHEGEIPREFTCDGEDKSPELNWKGVPEGTESFVLICDDPDVPEDLREHAPDLMWDHWVLFNIPKTCTQIAENEKTGPAGSICGKNSWGRNDWGGPCPPNPQYHRYFFKLYALDSQLNLDASADKKAVQAAMQGHILEETVLMGKYLRDAFK